MKDTTAIAMVGGACIGLALALGGYIVAGLPGMVVGFALTVPITLAWGYWWGSR